MNSKEILEGNRLIARFMGHFDEEKGFRHFKVGCSSEFLSYDNPTVYLMIKYHFSWAWLMPVVEKIESELGHLVHIVKKDVMIKENGMISSKEIVSVSCLSHITKLQVVYMAVIEFIKWYNSEKKNVNT